MDEVGSTFDALSAVAGSPERFELMLRLGACIDSTEALETWFTDSSAAEVRRQARDPRQVADQAAGAERITEQRRRALRAAVRDARQRMERAVEGLGRSIAALEERPEADLVADPVGQLFTVLDPSALISSSLGPGVLGGVQNSHELAYVNGYWAALDPVDRRPQLRHMAVLTAAAVVEPHIAAQVRILLRREGADQTPELERQVETRVFGGPSAWRKALRELCGATAEAAVDWDAFSTIWQIRNAIAHAGGIVDRSRSARTGLDVGVLELTDDDVKHAIECIAGVRLATAVVTLIATAPDARPVVDAMLGHFVVTSLRAECFTQAAAIARIQASLADDAYSFATAQVNRWLANRGEGRADEVLEEARSWDIESLPRVYGLARQVLLEDDDAAVATIADLLAANELTGDQLFEWPLFDGLVARGRLDSYLRSSIGET